MPRGRWLMAVKRDRIFELVDGWRKEQSGKPITELLEAVTAKLRSLSLREIRSWLAECESKKTALLNEFSHFERVYSGRQEDLEYHLCDDLIPHLRLEISRRGARTGTQPKENTEKTAENNSAAITKLRIGENIDKFRRECGWSFDKLAEKTGIDKKLILSHKHGKHKPNPKTLKEYAQAFTKELQRSITPNSLEE
jgi:DNA-binding XRE family transcriptional regulator